MRIEERIKAEAERLGFSLSGIAPATDADGFGRFEEWLSRGYHGDMSYLPESVELRRHPRSVLAEVRSVVMLGYEYGGRPEPGRSSTTQGRVAAYARGPDYHRYIWDRLNELSAWIEAEFPGSSAHGVTDTAPILERDFARRAGLGWVGKNAMLINPRVGSFFFLAALLTSLELQPDAPFTTNHCGTCTACLDACPTAAFPQPGVVDARRCVSYLTIELRTAIPDDLRRGIGDWVYGCDVCQDVCPWNRFAGRNGVSFPVQPELAMLDCVELLGLSNGEFRRRFRGTVFFRLKRRGLLRNAAIVLGNIGDERALPALDRAATDDDPYIREAAAWAAGRVRQRMRSS